MVFPVIKHYPAPHIFKYENISLIEREQTNVRLDILEKIVSYTGLTISELFTENFVKKLVRAKNNDT